MVNRCERLIFSFYLYCHVLRLTVTVKELYLFTQMSFHFTNTLTLILYAVNVFVLIYYLRICLLIMRIALIIFFGNC